MSLQLNKQLTKKIKLMKKVILLGAIAAIAFSACNQEQLDRQQKTIDSLNSAIATKDSSMSLVATTMADIQSNLNYIKEKENIISVSANSEDNKNQIKEDIQAIYTRLVDNKKKMEELQRKLNSSMSKSKEYQKIIEVLQQQIDQQNEQIEKLNKALEDKNIEIGYLNDAVIRLSSSVDSLATTNANTQQQLETTTEELNTVYYIVATKATLKEKGLLEGGLFTKKVLSGEVDNSLFTKIDKTTTEKIELSGRRFKVLTSHPETSYSIDEDNKVLTIKNKELFWKASKYLIIRAKGVDEADDDAE